MVDNVINLYRLCSEVVLSDVVTGIEIYLQKFENPKSAPLVKFIEENNF
jgi:hypothetical protein